MAKRVAEKARLPFEPFSIGIVPQGRKFHLAMFLPRKVTRGETEVLKEAFAIAAGQVHHDVPLIRPFQTEADRERLVKRLISPHTTKEPAQAAMEELKGYVKDRILLLKFVTGDRLMVYTGAHIDGKFHNIAEKSAIFALERIPGFAQIYNKYVR